MKDRIIELLEEVLHPETQLGLVSSGFVENLVVEEGKISITLRFAKVRDPFSVKIKNQVTALLESNFPALAGSIVVMVKEGAAPKPKPKEAPTATTAIANIVAISSAKGGVGKSTVTANIATTLRDMGFRVGILDADIYGPSQHKMFGCEQHTPEAISEKGFDYIIPAQVQGLKLISIGFFVSPSDALMWRGVMASNALKQLIHQTKWGVLDFLLIDLPPGTGDIHLSLLTELKVTSAVIVSTPQQVALADVLRGVEMFRHEQVNIPIAGIIENMAWFTPAELPNNRYYIFGKGGAEKMAAEVGIPHLGSIPIVQSIMECSDAGEPAAALHEDVKEYYKTVTEKMIANTLNKNGEV
ncbi:MAG: Mrp/NBP35 family ATP-binding protein [Rikenellaceae bacterium]